MNSHQDCRESTAVPAASALPSKRRFGLTPQRRRVAPSALLSATPQVSAPPPGVPVETLQRAAKVYVKGDTHRDLSDLTLRDRVMHLEKLFWWLTEKCQYTHVTRETMSVFFQYLRDGHEQQGGHWGKAKNIRPILERGRLNWFIRLHAFFHWCSEEEYFPAAIDPMGQMKKPSVPMKPLAPIPQEHINALLKAAKAHSCYPERDTAIMLFLLDTGVRISELCHLTTGDLAFSPVRTEHGKAMVLCGKGRKDREVYFSAVTQKALTVYIASLAHMGRTLQDPLFVAERGRENGLYSDGILPDGVRQMLRRMAECAHLPDGAKVSPHYWRRAFATSSFAQGADILSVQMQLGHSTPTMSLHYAKYTEGQVQRKHAQTSPVIALLKERR